MYLQNDCIQEFIKNDYLRASKYRIIQFRFILIFKYRSQKNMSIQEKYIALSLVEFTK